jgi:hypothetical protein
MALHQKEFSGKQAAQSDEFAPVGRFVWSVGQYRVEKKYAFTVQEGTAQKSELVLVEADSAERRLYTPLEDRRELFTSFAEIKTADDVLDFAKRYGRLGVPSYEFVKRAPMKRGEHISLESAERIADWFTEARAMFVALDLWEGINKGKDLETLIHWEKDGVVYRNDQGPRGWKLWALIAHATLQHASFYHRWERGELEGPARLHLAVVINSGLRNNVAPQLAFDDSHQFNEYTRPLNLLGAMWYQMCRAFTGEQPIGRCAECHKWMICDRSTKTMHEVCAVRVRQRRYREARNAETKAR